MHDTVLQSNRKGVTNIRRIIRPKMLLLLVPLTAILLFLLFPFYWTFLTSIKPEAELYGTSVTYWPQSPTLEAYVKLFGRINFLHPMKNSLIVALVTTTITLFVSLLAAYAFSRFEFKGRRGFMILFLTNNMFPTVLLLIPLYSIMRSIGLLYTPWALVLAYTTFTIPFTIWLLHGYLKDIPSSLEEAAMIDGANRAQAFIRIIMPVLVPCLIAAGVYVFMQSWNEYTFAVMFTNEANRTIPVALKNMIGQLGVQWDLLTAGGIITILPVCIMFFFAQKRLVSGLTAGAVKG
jgi:multiple sugar transport system permease protein